MNESKTEQIVREKLRQLGYYNNDNNTKVEEQQSDNDIIKNLLKSSSKAGKMGGGLGRGCPDFIISFKENRDLIIVIECKADPAKHESKTKDKHKKYAVDGVLLYSSHLSKTFNVLAIAVSGEIEKELKISHFFQAKTSSVYKNINVKQFLDIASYTDLIDAIIKPIDNNTLIEKAIQYNEKFHEYSVPETERCNLISSILTSLQNKPFLGGFEKHEYNKTLIEQMLKACEWVLEKNKIKDERQKIILHQYSAIEKNLTFKSETIKPKNKKKEEPNTILKDLIIDIRDSVLPFITSEKDFDILGKFYTEFIRYAGSDKKTGLVLTPSHITEWFCELANLQPNDKVYDPCCGTGGFLVSAMKYMMKKSAYNQEEYKKIKADRLFGVEKRPDMFAHACSNMMMRGDGKSHIYYDDCFNQQITEKIKSLKPTKSFLNPPYDVGDAGQLEFVENALSCIKPYGMCIAICQMSTVVGTNNKVVEVRQRLLDQHTLKAVFSMPDDLFHPIGVVTCILVFKAHQPHSPNNESFFGYFKDDGFVKQKHKGRVDDGTWEEKKKHMFNLYQNNKSETGLSITRCVTAKDEWCAEAYMETDYSKITEDDFIKTIKDYVAFKFLNNS